MGKLEPPYRFFLVLCLLNSKRRAEEATWPKLGCAAWGQMLECELPHPISTTLPGSPCPLTSPPLPSSSLLRELSLCQPGSVDTKAAWHGLVPVPLC